MPKAPWNADIASAMLAGHRNRADMVLVALQAVQEKFGHVPEEAVLLIARTLNVTRAEVHGVRTFYHDLSGAPRGRHTLKMCRAEACQSMGGEKLAQRAARALGADFGETTSALTLEKVYCLGLCAVAPAALFDDRPVGRLDDKTVDALLAEAQS